MINSEVFWHHAVRRSGKPALNLLLDLERERHTPEQIINMLREGYALRLEQHGKQEFRLVRPN